VLPTARAAHVDDCLGGHLVIAAQARADDDDVEALQPRLDLLCALLDHAVHGWALRAAARRKAAVNPSPRAAAACKARAPRPPQQHFACVFEPGATCCNQALQAAFAELSRETPCCRVCSAWPHALRRRAPRAACTLGAHQQALRMRQRAAGARWPHSACAALYPVRTPR